MFGGGGGEGPVQFVGGGAMRFWDRGSGVAMMLSGGGAMLFLDRGGGVAMMLSGGGVMVFVGEGAMMFRGGRGGWGID